MTQALNLANFANNLNTSGATTNAGLQNSTVTVAAGTGMSGGGAVSLGGTVTLTNAGVTSFNGSTGAVTVAVGAGTVTSVATGNGLSGGTITSTGTLVIACPSFDSVGSYCMTAAPGANGSSAATLSVGATLSGGFLGMGFYTRQGCASCGFYYQGGSGTTQTMSGTWRYMGRGAHNSNQSGSMFCRVS